MRSQRPYLSIVVPAYNECQRIGATLERIISYMHMQHRQQPFEIIVVDDGSDDGTSAVARSLQRKCQTLRVLRHEPNRGKGYSVKEGMLLATGNFLLFSDADLSTPIEEMEKMLPYLESGEYEIAIASRGLPESQLLIRQPFYREMMGRIFNLLVQAIAVPGIWDTQCGFKLFQQEAANRLFRLQRVHGFSFDAEILFLARRLGYRIKEVPVRWINSPHSKVHPIKHSARMLIELLKVRFDHCNQAYQQDYIPAEMLLMLLSVKGGIGECR